MINLKNLFTLAIAVTGFSAAAIAQTANQASASVNATIITPITIAKVADMNFGNVVSNTTVGTIVLSTEGVRTETGVQLPATLGTISAASFKVDGQAGYTYSVSLPTAAYEIKTGDGGATEVMTLSDFTSDVNTDGLLTNGTQTFHVGATLTVLANQSAGTYKGTTDFSVTVNYN